MTTISINCPNCGKQINFGESESATILQQIQTDEFKKQVKAEVEEQVAELSKHYAEKHEIELEREVNSALKTSEKEHSEEITELREQIEKLTLQLQTANNQVVQLSSKVESGEQATQLAVLKATDEYREKCDAQRLSYEEQLATERAKAAAEKAGLERSLELQKEQTEYYRDFKTKQSTKMIGESLEQHCEITFEQMRATAFPNAEFGKDNDIGTGSKGDYIFREKESDTGEELVSIMFEMKNETETDSVKHKNEDFLKKLDKDRNDKGCEYAVLVTMLEPDSELYNTGIVDVSHKYPKMFVIRPQFFLAIIGLIRNSARSALKYKHDLEVAKAQNIDVSNFEDRLFDFKEDFGKNVTKAGKYYEEAIESINKSIDAMEKTKKKLTDSFEQLSKANKKVSDVTVKKLTRGNPTVAALIEEARGNGQEASVGEVHCTE